MYFVLGGVVSENALGAVLFILVFLAVMLTKEKGYVFTQRDLLHNESSCEASR